MHISNKLLTFVVESKPDNMKVFHKSSSDTNGLKIASTYYPPVTNSINHWGDNLVEQLRKEIKPINEIKTEIIELKNLEVIQK